MTVINNMLRGFTVMWNAIKVAATAAAAWIRGKLQPLVAVASSVSTGSIKNALYVGVECDQEQRCCSVELGQGEVGCNCWPDHRCNQSHQGCVLVRVESTIKSAASSASAFVKSKFAAIAAPIIAVANKIKGLLLMR
jgi:hypothetical protein